MGNDSTLYSYCSILTVGCPVWHNPERTIVANAGKYSVFDYTTQGTRYVTVVNGVISSINNLCPVGPGSIIVTSSRYYTEGFGELPEPDTGMIEVARSDGNSELTPFYESPNKDWIEAKSDPTGRYIIAIRKLIAPEAAGKVEFSNDYGVSYSVLSSGITSTHNPVSVDMSYSGVYKIVGTSSGYLYHNLGTAPPNGNAFKAQTNIGIRNWTAVAMNNGGNIAIALASDGTVWRWAGNNTFLQSNVGGGSNSWKTIAMSADGGVIWIAGNNTHLHRSTDGGVNFAQVPITVPVPNVGNISSPFNFSNLATTLSGNNTVATIEPNSNSGGLGFIASNYTDLYYNDGSSVTYNDWDWAWGFTGYFPYNNIVNGSWTGLAIGLNGFYVYAVNNNPSSGGLYYSADRATSFTRVTNSKPYTSVSYVRESISLSCPLNGTLLEEYCNGTTLVQVFANGNCGSYTVTMNNSASCQTCNTYSVSDFGFVSYIDCNGETQYIYYNPGDFFCALSLNYGPAYQYATGCDGVPGGGIA
jgi:hypothetical protein